MPPCDPLLLVEAMRVAAPSGRVLLEDVSFNVAHGERVAVVGPNGAGKTTLVRVLSGGQSACHGRVAFDGRPMAGLSRSERARHVAVVAQSDTPDPRFVTRDYVALGRVPHAAQSTSRRDQALVAEALDICGVTGLAARRLGSLSGGERQRVIIARALAQQPRLLIVDEPTNHLDLRARADMLDLLRGLGVTVLAVLHDLALVPRFADRVLVLNQGRQKCFAPPSEALSPDVVLDAFGLECVRAAGPDGTLHLAFVPSARRGVPLCDA